ncbi:MAG: SMC-Scp complex subunit ScpB [Bdellovibrionaceae bacterium]|nr:SMC-Scp complex subunit ScpB [Pseudobdellovibrionaceae bacterium]|tara:strand:- start:143298 stop:144689 length:1392 start_codon:yes stop_codon:yes gene_type:complete
MSEDIIEPKEIELDELDAEQIEDGIVTENSEDAVEDLQFSENSESQYVEPASEGDEDSEEISEPLEASADVDVSGTELESFEAEEIEEKEFVEDERVISIVESVLFSTEKAQSVAVLKQAFRGTNVGTKQIKRAIERLMVEYAGSERGVTIEEVNGGFQLRTKSDNMDYLRRMVKARPFKLSGPALEVLSIVAYKQPCAKIQVDEVRGVESGHLVRGLMEKNLLAFGGKSELPGKPMLYKTTKRFLEIFGLRNLDELPSLSEIDELIPEGMDPEEAEKKETLGDVADGMAKDAVTSYSAATDELEKISDTLQNIDTSSEFFEEEKQREKERRDKERAQEIREKLLVGEEVDSKDQRWLERYDEKLNAEVQEASDAAEVAELLSDDDEASEISEALAADTVDDSEGELLEPPGEHEMEQVLQEMTSEVSIEGSENSEEPIEASAESNELDTALADSGESEDSTI